MSNTNKQNSCSQRPCQSRTIEHPTSTGSDDVNSELRGRPVLYAGVIWIGILRRFLIPRTCGPSPPLVGLEPTARSQEPPQAVSVNHVPAQDPASHIAQNLPPALLANNNPTAVPRRTEEALERRRLEMLRDSSNSWHSPLAALVSQMQEASLAAAEHALQLSEDVSALLRNSRDNTATIVSQLHGASLAAAEQALQLAEDIGAIMRNFKDTSAETLAVLRAEEASFYRFGAVAAAGLAGHLVGLPRGRATRLVYTATGATAAAVVCYPAEASVYNQQALEVLRRWMAYGLEALKQRQDPQRPMKDGGSEISKSSRTDEQTQSQQLNFHSPPQHSNITPSEDSYQDNNQEHAYSERFSDEGVNTPQGPEEHYYYSAPPMPPGPTGPTARRDRKLLSQCQPGDVIARPTFPTSVPHSPDAPLPPIARQSFNSSEQFKMPETPPSKSLPSASSKDNFGQNPVLSSHPHNERGHTNSTFQDLDTKVMEETREIHPNQAFEPNSNPLGIDKNSLACGDEGQSQYPLNKKLSQYYVKKPDGTIANSEAGYDDLYSRRE